MRISTLSVFFLVFILSYENAEGRPMNCRECLAVETQQIHECINSGKSEEGCIFAFCPMCAENAEFNK